MLETCKTMGVVACFAVAGFAVGCGGSSSNDESGSGSATAGLTTLGGSDTEGDTEESASGASNGATASGTSGASGNASTSETTTDSAGDTSDSPVFDIGSSPDGGSSCGGGGGGGGGGTDFSYIWIANSNEGTISKVNTQTLVEEGRYLVRPDGGGSPSRTSVNLNGDVVVASRQGGATMFAARTEDCPDPLNTSTGPDDVKPWPDGCMMWHTPFATDSQRPVAWSQGQFNDGTCRYENMKVWTSTHNSNTTIATIYRLNGDTGAIEDQVDATNVQTHVFGLYGAAVDADGNMWASELSVGQLVNVDLETMAIRQWNMPAAGYGMTVDSEGFVWTCSSTVARFDPTTLMETQVIPLPARVRGVSFDFEGNIWGPSINSNEAYRVNPVSLVTDTVTGFNYPYTYSDMTGFALSNAGTPSG
jgi:sugar lactone lactonase YvrE